MAFFYQDGKLRVGDSKHSTNLADIAVKAARPTYVYDLDNIELRCRALEAAFSGTKLSVHYAMKANNHRAVLQLMNQMNFGADTVSAGEIRLALEAGIPPERIIFSGVGKTVREIEFAIQKRIKQINVESPQELERIIEIARRLQTRMDVAFRMNPDVNPDTHPYITTGFRENKFGMDESFLPELKAHLRAAPDAVRLCGLTMHIGSQLLDLSSLGDALEKTLKVHDSFVADGFELDRIDIGGGIGVNYPTEDESSEFGMIKAYGKMVQSQLKNRKIEVMLEPGRILVARSGILLSEVQYIKRAPAKTFAIVDTGMHHLLRPALYGAKHRVLPLTHKSQSLDGDGHPVDPAKGSAELYDVVGPICESSDCLARDVSLADLKQGDWLGFADSGAYGFTMASEYNMHELPDEIAVKKGQVLPSL